MGALSFEEFESELGKEGGREVEKRVREVVGFTKNVSERKGRSEVSREEREEMREETKKDGRGRRKRRAHRYLCKT